MDRFKNNSTKSKSSDKNYVKVQTRFKKREKCKQMPLMGKSVLLARQADVTVMQHVNDSDVISKLVLGKFKNVLDYYHQRSWKRHSKYRFIKTEETKDDGTTLVPEYFVQTLTSDNVCEMIESPAGSSDLQEEKVDYDAQKFLYDALGDELNNYPTSNSETNTYKSNSIKRNFDDDYSVGTSDISTLLSKSNSSYSHFSRKLLRCNAYASSSMYDKDAYDQYQRCEDDCKATQLINEATNQHQVIVQTSKALNFCLSCKEFKHSIEYVEAEKILLLAIEKREAVLKELKFLEYEDVRDDCFCLGYIDLSNITVPLITQNILNSFSVWIFGIVSCGPNVYATEVIQVDNKTYISFKKSFKFDHLSSDFEIKIRLYSLKVLNTKNYAYDSTIRSLRETTVCPVPYKLLGFSRNPGSKRIKQCHSYERRQPSFVLDGTVIVHISDLKNATFLLSRPHDSPLVGTVDINISSSIQFFERYSAFLTVGSEAGGLITWNLRWCHLSGYLLQCWNYPQDQEFSECIVSVDLRYCVNAYISRVDRELCARPRTILIETGSLSDGKDENSRIIIQKSSYTITRHYLSADTVEDMDVWEKKLNSVIFALRNWNCMMCPPTFTS